MPETPFSWRCPNCGQNATITKEDYSRGEFLLDIKTVDGFVGSEIEFTVCPNPDCKSFVFTAALHETPFNSTWGKNLLGARIKKWTLVPSSGAMVLPDYVPKAVRNDYQEACLILEPSPKASATLSRRALQGMIRHFWEVKKANLKAAIDAIKDKVDPLTWNAIEGVRTIGNIGAHMEMDIDLIVDVEPEEADKLIWLVETLVKDWYVDKHEKEARLAEIAVVAEGKERERRGGEEETTPGIAN